MEDPAAAPPIYHHSPLHPSPLPALLKSVLPAGLPLYRRLQFPLRSGFEFILATFPATTQSLPPTFAIAYCDRSRRPEGQCFILSSLEVGNGWQDNPRPFPGEIEIGNAEGESRPGDYPLAVAQLRALLKTVFALPYPPSQDEPGYAERRAANIEARTTVVTAASATGWGEATDPVLAELVKTRGVEKLTEADRKERNFILLGAVHEFVARVLHEELGLVLELGGARGVNETWANGYRGWLFDVDELARRVGVTQEAGHAPATSQQGRLASVEEAEKMGASVPKNLGVAGLPAGLHWSSLSAKDLTTVRSRTHIPRREGTMRLIPSVCVRRLPGFVHPTSSLRPSHTPAEDAPIGPDDPIAWGFLGVDGSLSSLHVEPAFRGLGLAKAVAAKLFVEGISTVHGATSGERWAHSEVAEDNEPSLGVMRSLGGKKGREMWWMRADLGRL